MDGEERRSRGSSDLPPAGTCHDAERGSCLLFPVYYSWRSRIRRAFEAGA